MEEVSRGDARRRTHMVVESLCWYKKPGRSGKVLFLPFGHATDLVPGLKSWAGLLSRDIPVRHTELLSNVSVFSHQPDRVGGLSQEGLLACLQT